MASFPIPAEVFFGLSFALLLFTFAPSLYETGVTKTVTFVLTPSTTSFAPDVIGTNTGFLFGKYHYTDFLGAKFLGVPAVVPLVRFIITYLTFQHELLLVQHKRQIGPYPVRKRRPVVVPGRFWHYGMGSTDRSDVQFIRLLGLADSSRSAPFRSRLTGVPVTNFFGWFVVSFLIFFFLLCAAWRRRRGSAGSGTRGVL